MFDGKLREPDERELARHMSDQAARMESPALARKKYFQLQRLMAKLSSLSDEEFEFACLSVDSLIEGLVNKKMTQPGLASAREKLSLSSEVASRLSS